MNLKLDLRTSVELKNGKLVEEKVSSDIQLERIELLKEEYL